MANLEKIVRPFATRSLTPGNLVASNSEPPANIILQYGKNSGSASILSGSYSLSASWYMDAQVWEPKSGEQPAPTPPEG